MPGLISPGRQRGPGTGGREVFDTMMGGLPAVTDVANLSDFSPRHGGQLRMQVNDELAHLWWQRAASFSRSALLSSREQALHPVSFKLIRFTRQRALGDIDFLCTLPCGFLEKDEGSDLLVQLLLKPQRPLFDTRPFIGALSAGSFRARHLPLPFRSNDACFKRTQSPKSLQEIRRG